MQYRLVDPIFSVRYKRYGQIGSNAWIYSEKEVVEVATPFARTRHHAMRPSHLFVQLFAVVDKVVGKFAYNVKLSSKGQETRRRWMELHILFRDRHCANATQEHLIILIVPDMHGVKQSETIAIAVDGIHVKHRPIHRF